MENKCVNCGSELHGKFCSNCGEKVYGHGDKHIAHLFEETLHFLTHFEGKFLITLKTIFTKPGKLSLDYCSGIRKKYFKPASFYFLLVVIYLLFPVARGLNLPFEYFSKSEETSWIKKTINAKQTGAGLTYELLNEKYERKSEKISKFFLIIILPLCALVLKLLFFNRPLFFFDYFILSAEINSMFLLAIFLILPLLGIPLSLISTMDKNALEVIDTIVSALAFIIIASHSASCFRRMFGLNRIKAGFFGVLFGVAQMYMVFFIYRNLLFFTVMALI